MSYYQHMRQHYGLSKIASAWEVVMAWFRGDIENRKSSIEEATAYEFNPDGIPTLFETFSMLRANSQRLETMLYRQASRPRTEYERETMIDIIAELSNIGDYDEPLSLLIRDALDGKLDKRSRKLLEHIISESS